MTKAKEDTAPAAEVAVTTDPTMADMMALIKSLQAQVAKQAEGVKSLEVDFSAAKAAALKAGFKATEVPGLQKGASPALRVDY